MTSYFNVVYSYVFRQDRARRGRTILSEGESPHHVQHIIKADHSQLP